MVRAGKLAPAVQKPEKTVIPAKAGISPF